MTHRFVLALATAAAAAVVPSATALADGHRHHGATPSLQAVAGTVTAVSDAGLQVQVVAVGRPGPRRPSSLTGATIAVSVTPQTRLLVSDVNGDGSVTLADVSVGDQVIVSSADASASPVVAASVLDRTHQPPSPGDQDDGDDGPATPPVPAAPATPGTPAAPADPGTGGGHQAGVPLRRLLHRTLRLHAEVDAFAPGVLSVTVASLDRLPRHLNGAAISGLSARVLVGRHTLVLAGGHVLRGDARAAALASAGDVVITGRLTPPSSWPADTSGTAIPTLRARRIVIGAVAAPADPVTPTDPSTPTDPTGPADPPPVITN